MFLVVVKSRLGGARLHAPQAILCLAPLPEPMGTRVPATRPARASGTARSGEPVNLMRHATSASRVSPKHAPQQELEVTHVPALRPAVMVSGVPASPVLRATSASKVRHRHAQQAVPLAAVEHKLALADSGVCAHAQFHAKPVIAVIAVIVP